MAKEKYLLSVSGRFLWAGYLLGFSLGGFFDGILLHQLLQWHHLLSAVESDPFRDLRFQIMFDGIFHALMYVIMAAGLYQLWQSRHDSEKSHSGRLLLATLLMGFGVWHVFDGIFSHLILGIHRIHPQSENPLFWDLFFFAGLGLGLWVAGYWLKHRDNTKGSGPSHSRFTALLLVIGVVTAAGISAVPWKNTQAVTVVFPVGTSLPKVFTAATAVDARLLWHNKAGNIWIFHLPEPSDRWQLYRYGARYVSSSFPGVGCFTAPESARLTTY
jgi:uncharacterized membrane protein